MRGIQKRSRPVPTHFPNIRLDVGVAISGFSGHISLMHALIAALSPAHSAIVLHALRSSAIAFISSRDKSGGRSMKKPPSDLRLNCAFIESLTSLSPLSLKRCPSQTNLLSWIAWTRSKVLVLALASWWAFFPVKRLRSRAFAPLIIAAVLALRSHASHPYVSREHIAVL